MLYKAAASAVRSGNVGSFFETVDVTFRKDERV